MPLDAPVITTTRLASLEVIVRISPGAALLSRTNGFAPLLFPPKRNRRTRPSLMAVVGFTTVEISEAISAIDWDET